MESWNGWNGFSGGYSMNRKDKNERHRAGRYNPAERRRKETMFKKLLDELLAATTQEAITDILYRKDGVDLSYQREKLSWDDHERLFKLAGRLSESI